MKHTPEHRYHTAFHNITKDDVELISKAWLIPELLEACIESYDLIRDIVNASGNGQPYDTKELDRICTPIFDQLHTAIKKATE